MLPQSLGYDGGETLDSEYHHEDNLGVVNIWQMGFCVTSISSNSLFVSSVSLFGYGVFIPGGKGGGVEGKYIEKEKEKKKEKTREN